MKISPHNQSFRIIIYYFFIQFQSNLDTHTYTHTYTHTAEKMHWKSPLIPIPFPINPSLENVDRQDHDDSPPAIHESSLSRMSSHGTTATARIKVPFTGLYGFILGPSTQSSQLSSKKQNRGSFKEGSGTTMLFESRIRQSNNNDDETSITSNSMVSSSTKDERGIVSISSSSKHNEDKKKKEKQKQKQTKLEKQLSKLPFHCGYTFKATFHKGKASYIDNDHNNFSDEPSICDFDESSSSHSILLPFTSQIVDPINCNLSQDSSEKLLKIISSTKVSRLIYIQKNTVVTMECIDYCNKDDDDSSKTIWEWGLISHCIDIQNEDDEQKTKKSETSNKLAVVDTTRPTNDEDIQMQEEKRARYTMDSPPGHPKVEQDNTSKIDGDVIVNFFPKEAERKPLLCSECSRKFPTTDAIHKHAIIAHIDTMAVKGSQEYIDLVGPPIIRKPLYAAYEDDHLVVVIKPQGLIVQGDKWTLGKSDLLMPFRCKDKNICDALSKPRAVHRLDGATGGLLVVAKTRRSEVALRKCFAERACQKRYRAIVFGRLEGNIGDQSDGEGQNAASGIEYKGEYVAKGIINSPISGKDSTTYYYVVSYSRCLHDAADGWISTVDLYPVSGRQHQLRRHMKLVGHPIFGDRRYGPYEKGELSKMSTDCEEVNVAENPHAKLCLWALEIDIKHPMSEKNINVKINEPEWYKSLRQDQERKWNDESNDVTTSRDKNEK